ncbi:MAG TPA: hypothetical protein VMH02_11490, partial [Verrucomicrobiae bacterium]|nr:hypothetical protein [Verrucomicrobiae bacterium]
EPKYGYYEVDVVSGGKTTLCYGGPNNSDTVLKWKEGGCSLAKFGGEKVTLKFYVYDNGYKSKYVNWYVDDVTVSG